jgi:hypothetical protein
MFLAIPLCLVTATSVATNAPTQVPSTASWALQCLKSGYHNLIHQADLQIGGKTVSDTQPFLGTFTHIKLLSELSQNDLRSIGTAIGFSEVLDSVGSTRWNGNSVDRNGNGLTNNTVFGSTTQVTAEDDQNTGVCSEAINKRVLKTIDGTKAGFNGIVTNIVSADQLKAEFKTVYQVQGTNYGVVYDLALTERIPLACTIH